MFFPERGRPDGSGPGMRRLVRLVAVILIALLAVPIYTSEPAAQRWHGDYHIMAEPVVLHPGHPAERRLGALTYLGGVALSADRAGFGGFSAMHVAGDRFTLLSDTGNILRFRLGEDWSVREARVAPLPAGPGRGWRRPDRDSESLARDPETGDWLVGFESHNEIWRYTPDLSRALGRAAPPAMQDWSDNGGPEALTRLADGSVLVFAEATRDERHRANRAIVFTGDPLAAPRQGFRFFYRPPQGYQPTDAAQLRDGRILVLNRRLVGLQGFWSCLAIVDPARLAPGKVATGVPIAFFVPPVTRDNFEALAVTQHETETILWIASDDNQSVLQRSLLLKFRLDLPERRPVRPPRRPASSKSRASDDGREATAPRPSS